MPKKTKKTATKSLPGYLYALLVAIILASGIFIYRRLDTNPAPVATAPIDVNQLTTQTDVSQLMKCHGKTTPSLGCNTYFFHINSDQSVDIYGTGKEGFKNGFFQGKIDPTKMVTVKATLQYNGPVWDGDQLAKKVRDERMGIFFGKQNVGNLILRAIIRPSKQIYQISYYNNKSGWKILEEKAFPLADPHTPVSLKVVRLEDKYKVFAKVVGVDTDWKQLSYFSFSKGRYDWGNISLAGIIVGNPGHKDLPDTELINFHVTDYSITQTDKGADPEFNTGSPAKYQANPDNSKSSSDAPIAE